MANRDSDLWAGILAASMVVLLVGAPALTAAAANADNNNHFSVHLQGKAGSSPVYLADKNDKSGDGGGDHGKSGDNKHNGGSSSGEGDTSNDTTTSDNSSGDSGSDDSGSGATDSHEDETVPADNAEENSTSSQVTPVEQEAQQNDEQPENPPPENQAYPEDTYPDSYFSDKPLKKMELQRYLILDQEGNAVSSARPGESIKISASYKNLQQKEQRYALITQIVDQNGVTADVSWSIDTIESGGYADWSKLWKPDSPAEYTIKTIVWSGVSENPLPLSDTNVMAVAVQ